MSDSGGYRGGDDMHHDDMTQGDPRLEAVFGALGQPDAVDPAVASRHVAMAAAAAAAAPVTAPATEPATPWYRRVLVRGASLGLTAKMLLGTAVAVAATGGAAAGGILPDPVQSFIADTVSHVGVDLPNPRLATTTTTTVPTTTTVVGDTATTSTTIEEHGDDEIVETAPLVPGSRSWTTTTCTGDPITVHYTITEDGELELDSVVGDPDDIDSDDDRIRIEFDDLRIDIRIVGDEVVVDEDRFCGSGDDAPGTTTTTTVPDDDDDESDDDSDDSDGSDDESDDDEGTTTTTVGDHPQAGSHQWTSTSCAGDTIVVRYTVTEAGELVLGTITGDVADIDTDDDEITVEFTDGITIDVTLTDDALVEHEDRDCGSDD